MEMPKEWYTVNEAAHYLGVSRRTIYKLTKEGRLQAYLLGKERTRRFRKEDLDRGPRALERGAEEGEVEAISILSSAADPVLAELWGNEKDAAYDSI